MDCAISTEAGSKTEKLEGRQSWRRELMKNRGHAEGGQTRC